MVVVVLPKNRRRRRHLLAVGASVVVVVATTTTTTTEAPVLGKLSASCNCLFQGSELPDSIINGYPYGEAGKYNSTALYPAIKLYGTTCAAWDYILGTPW